MAFLRSLLLTIFVPLASLITSLIAVFVVAPFFPKKGDFLIRCWAHTLVYISGIDIEVRGLNHLSQFKSGILVSNHLSHFDIPVLYAALPIPFRMAAKSELFKIPIFGWAMRSLGFFSIERQNPKRANKALLAMGEKFERGESVWMAPEGTRQATLALGDFKMGPFYLALKTAQPLLPILILGTEKILPKGRLLVNKSQWRQKVIVQIGEPIAIEGWSEDRRHDLRDHVKKNMEELLQSHFCP